MLPGAVQRPWRHTAEGAKGLLKMPGGSSLPCTQAAPLPRWEVGHGKASDTCRATDGVATQTESKINARVVPSGTKCGEKGTDFHSTIAITHGDSGRGKSGWTGQRAHPTHCMPAPFVCTRSPQISQKCT